MGGTLLDPSTSSNLPVAWSSIQELKREGTPAKMNGLTVERALMERLSNPPTETQQWPVHYLLGCYARASGTLLPLAVQVLKAFRCFSLDPMWYLLPSPQSFASGKCL